jgi:hypothetical protein
MANTYLRRQAEDQFGLLQRIRGQHGRLMISTDPAISFLIRESTCSTVIGCKKGINLIARRNKPCRNRSLGGEKDTGQPTGRQLGHYNGSKICISVVEREKDGRLAVTFTSTCTKKACCIDDLALVLQGVQLAAEVG